MNASACPVSILTFCRGILPLLLLVFGCELGESPLAPKINDTDTPDIVVRPDSVTNMRIRALRPTLQASFDDSSAIEVTVLDENHNPLPGKEVRFSADGGTISARDTSDEKGIARAVFIAEPANRNVIIQASMKYGTKTVTVGTTVSMTGVAVEVSPSRGSAPTGVPVSVKITLVDGNNNPLPDRPVRITGNDDTARITDGRGEITTTAILATPGSITIIASVPGSADSASISFGTTIAVDSVNRYMRVRASPSTVTAAYNEKAQVEVTVFDDNRNPVAGKTVRFTTTAGTITTADTTDADGLATANFSAEPLSGNVVISASMKLGDTTLTVGTTVTLKGVVLKISPLHVAAPPGTPIPVTIRLLDGKSNPVADRQIQIGGNGDSTKTTNGDGEVYTVVNQAAAGTVHLYAAALGVTESVDIVFGSTGPVGSDNTVRSLRLFTAHAQLQADNRSEDTITAVLIDADAHNPLIGEVIRFSSTLGIIDQTGITDEHGRTSVVLRSAPVNGTCVVKALLESNADIKDSTSVLFSGVTLELTADRNNIRIDDTSVVTAILQDGAGNPISGDFVTFSTRNPGTFPDGAQLSRLVLSSIGTAPVKVTSATAGRVMVYATSANIDDSVAINVTTNNLSVASARGVIVIGGRDSTQISARYLDMSGNPLADKTIIFATNAGVLTASAATTNSNGVASTWLMSGYFATEATVEAKSPDGSEFVTVVFRAATPKSVTLSITPDNIGVNGGTATLIATVKDDSGNVVSGANVAFRILKGPGGGEKIDRPIIVSTNEGIARAALLAGSLPSAYRGCEVEAIVNGVAATNRLTISGEPHTITISRPEDDTVKVPNGGHMNESTFDCFVGAVVSDVNGNPVADGTEVNFSVVVSGMSIASLLFDHWETVKAETTYVGADSIPFVRKVGNGKAIMEYRLRDIPFEDINNNLRFDQGIDLDLDDDHAVAARGYDRDGDGKLMTSGFFWDFDMDGVCDTASNVFNGEPYNGKMFVTPQGDTIPDNYADLNDNGRWDQWECPPAWRSQLPPNAFTTAYGYDFEYWQWEMRDQFYGKPFDFTTNDFAVVVQGTAATKNGVASNLLSYPRQLAKRLFVTVNAEAKGIRDRDGERFVLPVVRD